MSGPPSRPTRKAAPEVIPDAVLIREIRGTREAAIEVARTDLFVEEAVRAANRAADRLEAAAAAVHRGPGDDELAGDAGEAARAGEQFAARHDAVYHLRLLWWWVHHAVHELSLDVDPARCFPETSELWGAWRPFEGDGGDVRSGGEADTPLGSWTRGPSWASEGEEEPIEIEVGDEGEDDDGI